MKENQFFHPNTSPISTKNIYEICKFLWFCTFVFLPLWGVCYLVELLQFTVQCLFCPESISCNTIKRFVFLAHSYSTQKVRWSTGPEQVSSSGHLVLLSLFLIENFHFHCYTNNIENFHFHCYNNKKCDLGRMRAGIKQWPSGLLVTSSSEKFLPTLARWKQRLSIRIPNLSKYDKL